MNKTILFDELNLSITEQSSVIGGIWTSETDLTLSEEQWFETIYLDITMHDNPFVIDIGASTGCLSLFNKNLGFPIFSFEPNKVAFQELLNNVWNNQCNTLCYNVALGDQPGTAFMSQHPELWGYGYNKIEKTPTELEVEIQKLDTMIPFNAEVTHVKIDVEGYELFVLKGMHRILSQKPTLYIEMIESNFQNFSYSSSDLIKFLESYDYNHIQIDENNFKFI
jgi:FkbM family methyltransferase